MRFFFFSVFIFTCFIAKADKIDINTLRFTPHISAEAYTQKKWGMSFQRAVGANLNTSFLLTSFSIAVSNRVEIGTIPTHYLNKAHKGNLSVKYNFWRTPQYMWSLGFNSTSFAVDDPNLLATNKDARVAISTFQLLLNYFPKWTALKFGFNINGINTHLEKVSKELEEQSLKVVWEFGIDISSPRKKNLDLTLGLGWLREDGVTALEKVNFGSGLSFRWYREKKLLSSPTLGAHLTPKTGHIKFLFSSSIF